MSGEPEIQEGESGEWVLYLQQLMRHHLFWNGEDDGAFTPELTAAVIALQQSAAISPADGVVRASTWDSLHGLSATENQGYGQTEHHTPTEPASTGGSGNPAAGVGVPSFTYTLPNITLAEATVATPNAVVHMQLLLSGSVQVTFQQSVQGYTLNLNDGEWKVAAQSTLHGVQEGVEVSGFVSGQPSIASQWGNQFSQTSVQFTAPNTMTFAGQVNIDYPADTAQGPAKVTGQPGYQLVVTVTPNATPDPVPVDEPSWFEVHAGELAAAAAVVLVVGVAIALAPETGGGSLVLAGAAL